MFAHGGNLMVTGLLATVSVGYVCGMVVTRGVLVPPETQNNRYSMAQSISSPVVSASLFSLSDSLSKPVACGG